MLLLGGGGRAAFHAHVRARTGREAARGIGCLYCHLPVTPPPTRGDGDGDGDGYISPAGLAVSADSRTLFVAGADSNQVLEVDLKSLQVTRRVPVGTRPLGLALSPGGDLLAVACQVSDEIVLLDTGTLETTSRLPAPAGPAGVVFMGPRRLAVAHSASRDVALMDLDGAVPLRRLPAGQEPFAVARSADGRILAAVSRLVTPAPDDVMPGAVLTLVDGASGRILKHERLLSAHLSEGLAVAADGSFVLAPVVRFRHFLPTTQLARGAVMTSALTYLDTDPHGAATVFPLDEVNAFFADPSGVAMTPDESLAFIASGGTDQISVVDVAALRRTAAGLDDGARARLADDLGAFSGYVLARLPTGANPRSLAVTPDGRRLLVAEHLDDSVAVINIRHLETEARIDLGGPRELTARRRGERVFHDATGTFQSEFSCRSCHPDGQADGLIWDFEIDGIGRHRLETRSLLGVRDTAPFKWSGKNPDLETQCGNRFSRVLMRSEPFSPQRLEDLVTFIRSLPLQPRRAALLDAGTIARGRRLFFRTHTRDGTPIPMANRCSTCHRPPLYTDRLTADVGTGDLFDTPHLAGVAASPPYLHDGRARTLEEIWTVYSPDDRHGVTSDMSKVQLNDLMIFLRTL
ncbi:MAG: beta-propeller fold lactonase family protein [Rhodospirillales bacterium]